ncbi:hypothetical protein SORBI_3003G443601 [Sorghum bicolor]|uniref:Uncharacterized protein n=1 Tax=Sorghum bicolor TaxID=4558 RepID=A0A1W0W1L2_SORBI|nr:hypothetical protein SORBI_3003G443601 [Sorghum bicolor]OQU88266.1 hypothetical protein SORBI_3003G443601 [Sorghum bicolor]
MSFVGVVVCCRLRVPSSSSCCCVVVVVVVVVRRLSAAGHGHHAADSGDVHAGWHGHLRLVHQGVRHRRGREDVVGRGRPLVGEPLHPLHVQPVLLQVAGHVLPRQPFHVHQLHDGLGHRVLDPQVRHHVHEPLVQLRRPHQPGTLAVGACVGGRRRRVAAAQGRRRRVRILVPPRVSRRRRRLRMGMEGREGGGAAPSAARRRRRRRAPQPRHRGRRRAVHVQQRPPGLRRDAERRRQTRGNQRLRQRGQLVGAREPRLPLHHAAVVVAAVAHHVELVVVHGLLAHPNRWIPPTLHTCLIPKSIEQHRHRHRHRHRHSGNPKSINQSIPIYTESSNPATRLRRFDRRRRVRRDRGQGRRYLCPWGGGRKRPCSALLCWLPRPLI